MIKGYKLTLKQDYNKITFEFYDLEDMTTFLENAINANIMISGTIEPIIDGVEKEDE